MAFKTLKDWPADLFITQYLKAGDTVDNAMYEHFFNVASPHCFHIGYLQAGGGNYFKDEDGKLKSAFLTFVQDEGRDFWIFKGECFSREWINRNPELEPADEKFRKSILDKLEKQGFDVSQIELNIEQYIDDEHKSCLWYGGPVATVEYKDHVFWLEAHGDVSATLLDTDYSKTLCDVRDKNNGGRFYEEMSNYIKNDKDLGCLKTEGRLVFSNNNWFEIFVETPDGVKHDLMDVCSSDYLDDCIFEMVESMDLVISDVSKENVDVLINNAKQTCEEVNKGVEAKENFELEKE